MRNHALPRTLLAAILIGVSVVAAARTMYWVGGPGNWNDAAHWSFAMNGVGGAGVPQSADDVVIAPGVDVEVMIEGRARCAALRIDATNAFVRIDGPVRSEFTIDGDIQLLGAVHWAFDGTARFTGAGNVDTRGVPMDGSLVFDSEGLRTITSDVALNSGDITVRRGIVRSITGLVRARSICSEGRATKRLEAGNTVVQLERLPDASVRQGLVDAETSTLMVAGARQDWGADVGERDARDVNICGTGAGQTPFTATTSALTDFNGFHVRCRGQCNATITVNVTGGSGNFTYSWLFGGPNTQTWVGACGGPQIVVVTDQGQGVSCAVSLNVTEPSPLGVIFFGSGTPPTCADVCNGSRTALAVGGVPGLSGYSYSWNNGAGTGSSFNALCAGTNTLHITDANLCTFDTTFIFNILPVVPNLTFTNVTCNALCDGTASVNPSGGTPNYTVTWTPPPGGGQGTNNATGLCAGNYSVLIVDSHGCDTTVVFQIIQPPPIIPNATHVDASCFGSCNGTASVAPSGSVGPYTYSWVPAPGGGQNTANATGLCAGLYTVTITDVPSQCNIAVPITILAPPAIDVQGTATDATCSDNCNGSIAITINSLLPPFTITWSPVPPVGQGTTNVSGLCAGNWQVTVATPAGCDTTIVFTVDAPPPLVPNLVTTDVTCSGACDGTATLNVTGGTSPYNYLWTPAPSGGQGTPAITGLCAGNYTLLVTDANGCDTLVSFIILEPPPLQATPTQANVSCGGLCDGTASVMVVGGSPGYTYLWTPAPGAGQGTGNATGLCAGNYSVLMMDTHGCTLTQPFVILAAVPMQLSLQVFPATCPNVCDGTAGVIVSGGVAPYTYAWAPNPGTGQGTANVTGLCPQAYTLTVTDLVGCDTTIAFTVPAPPPITVTSTVTNPVCNGDCNGSIALIVAGGNGIFTYAWVPPPGTGQGTASAGSLCAGSYNVTITSGACDTTLTFLLTAPPPINASLVTVPPTCAGGCDGTATATVSGGTAPYTYLWTPAPTGGQGTPDATGLCAGNYTLLVTDGVGCDTTLAFTLIDPLPIIVDLVTTPASCGGLCDGTATAIVSGGTAPYTYDWQPAPGGGQGTPNATDLCPGAYVLTVTDAVGCSVIIPFAISTPSGIIAVPTVTNATCGNNCDGIIGVVTSGGLPPYTYLWSPQPGVGQGTPNVSGLCPGIWTLQISDAAQCDTVLLIPVSSPPVIIPNESHTDENCLGPCNGTASVNPTGGQPPFTYFWSPLPPVGQGTPNASNLCPAIWSVTITDITGCDTTVVFDILPKMPIQDNLVWTSATCPNACDGTASVVGSGGVPPYTYQWTPTPLTGQGTPDVTGLCLGVWQIRIFDSIGCFSSTDFWVDAPVPFNSALTTTPETCVGTCTGTANVNPTGGTGTIVIDWQPPPGGGQGTTTATGLCAGTNYSVTFTDDSGCDSTFTFTIAPFTAIVANSSSTPVTCSGLCNGTATVGPTGGTAPYSYVWVPQPGGGQNTPNATGLCEGVYTVTITDAGGCSIDADILITGPAPIADNAVATGIQCAAQCNGSVALAPSGGVAPYTIVWSPVPPNGQGVTTATGLCAGTWNATITDASGCSASFSYDLAAPTSLVIQVVATPSECQVCIGTASVTVSGGTPNYAIAWRNAAGVIISTDPDVIDLCAGLYTVTVTDANGCSIQQAVPITDSNGEVLTMTDGNTSCPNACDGSVSVAFNCSDPVCTIAWSDAQGNDLGQSGNSLSGLCPGDYYAIITNASGCISIDTATVVAPPPTTLLTSSTPVSCAGLCDGTATIGVSGGIAPYIFFWDPPPGGGQGTPFVTGLCAGVYTVAVNDGGGCDTTAQILITEPLPLTSGAIVIDIGCTGQCDGNISLAIAGGTPNYAIVWSPVPPSGQGVAGAFGLCAGDWTATITDAHGCSISETYTINEPAPIQVSVNTVPSTCPNCDGQASATITGGTAPYTVAWSLGGVVVSTDPDATALCGGLYILNVSDVNGCSVTQVVQVSDSNAEVITPTNGQTTCANNCDGTVSVSFICTTPPCNIQWTDAQGNVLAVNTPSLTNLCVGTYTAQVTNGGGCVSFADAVVLPSQTIVPNLSSTPVSCAGLCDGTATVGPTGGMAPYIYHWDPPPGTGQDTPFVTGLCAGVYTVTITDATTCDTIVQVLITEPQPLVLNGLVTDVSCAGDCDGSVTVIVTGGTMPYTYAWSPAPSSGQGTPAVSGLCAGPIDLTVTDASGCISTQTFTIGEPAVLDLSITTTQSECGLCNGTATATITGGTAPYFVEWMQGAAIIGTGDAINGLCAGFYTAIVIDANLCTTSHLVVVSDIDGEVVAMTDGLTTCPGDCDGEVSAAFNCSDPACSTAWFDGSGIDLNEPSNTLSNLCAGMYFVQVTNGSGCITIDTAFVVSPPPIVANLSTTAASCNGVCDGTATVGPTGGQPPYDYVWSPQPPIGQGTPQADSLCAGTWNVVISDAAGCSISVDVLITEPTALTATSTVTEITCNGACDGTITVVPSGGTQPYTYFWDPVPNGQGGNTVTDLCAGDWSVTITDGNGCSTTYDFTLVDPPVLVVDVTTTDNACFGDCQGTADVSISGGVAPYTNVWRDDAGTIIAQDVTGITDLCAGNYSVDVMDANGCAVQTPFSIAQPQPIDAGLLWTNETCFGPCDGTASVTPSGGAGPYIYDWQPPPATGQGTAQVTGLCAGQNGVTITDSGGCDTTYTFTVLPYQPIMDNATVVQVDCNGACDGSIVTVPTGGIGSYSFVWSPVPPNGQGNAQATSLCPNTYSLTITDGAGCDSTFGYSITEPTALVLDVDVVIAASCADANDGAIAVTISGGSPGYVISWNGPNSFQSNDEDLNALRPGPYSLTITDNNGCTLDTVIVVDALSTVLADAGADQTHCEAVVFILDGSQSIGAVTYEWRDDQNNVVGNTAVVTLPQLGPGTHTFTLTVSDGPCTSTDQVVIDVLSLPIASAGPDQTIFLGDEVTLGGAPTGPPGSSFVWLPDSVLNSGTIPNPIAEPSATTWFTVLVTSPNGCTDLDSVLVTVVPEVVIPTGFTPNGDGWNNVWQIDFIELFPECEVEVYNRWGDRLFRSVGYKEPWDGKYNGGFVPVGTYYYVVKLNDERFPDAYTGPLTVIR